MLIGVELSDTAFTSQNQILYAKNIIREFWLNWKMTIEEILDQCGELKKQKGDFDDYLDDNKEAKDRFKRMLLEMYEDGELTKPMAYRRYLELKESMDKL